MDRRWDVFANHVSIATRTSAGVATSPVQCGEYGSGQLVLRVIGLAAGGKVKPIWLSSLDGANFGTLASGTSVGATGVYILTPPPGGGVGIWAKARWTLAGATAVKFGIGFSFQE